MTPGSERGVIAWFAHNPVAANLLMFVIIAVGIGYALSMRQEMMPSFDIDAISVSVVYPGAAPEEVEQGVVLKIEDAISDLKGIERVWSESYESRARILIGPNDGEDVSRLQDSIRNRIDAIQHFPAEAEKAIVSRIEFYFPAITLQLSGAIDERGMKALAEDIKRDLLTYPEISTIQVWGARDYEISIEVAERDLLQYDMSLGDISNIIAASSLDLPAGSVRTESGDIMLRTRGQAYVQRDFETIVLRTFPDGTRLLLGDIATVRDDFEEASGFSRFNNEYSIGLEVQTGANQDITAAANRVKDYAEQRRRTLPPNLELTVWSDSTFYLNERLLMMLGNLGLGTLLVFIVLALFLEIKLAFWVMVGIPVCFLGAIAIYGSPLLGGSLNMISIFGFILVLGIVVDDAIIVGESAYSEQERHGYSVDNVVNGVYRVATPATFGVLTTIVAFAPTLFVDGVFAAFPEAVGFVVILCLVFSLIESKWILPAHLAHSRPTTNPVLLAVDKVQERINFRLRKLVTQRYQPFMHRCVRNRYTTLATFLSALIIAAGLVGGGIVRTAFHPDIPGEFLAVELRMTAGTAENRTIEVLGELDRKLRDVESRYLASSGRDEQVIQHVYMSGYDRINGLMAIELTKEDRRSISTSEVLKRWRESIGTIHGAEVLSITAIDGPDTGPDISLDLKHKDFGALQRAAADLAEALSHYSGVYDIRNGASDTADEFHLELLPEAEALGITRAALGTQLRHAFYGAEAQRVQRGIDEVKVMVRYPASDRVTTASLGEMYVRTPGGDAVPLDTVAKIATRPGYLKTTRIDYRRAAEITAKADKNIVDPNTVISEVEKQIMPQLMARYPGLEYELSGLSEESGKMARSMGIGFILALFGIYALLAIPTRSYLQPLIIMGVIPFGIIGAVFGHLALDLPMSMMSLMGVIALSGVVVNDSLILVDYTNRCLREGLNLTDALQESTGRRFRAILLTSMTTFMGLVPMMLERSVQAREILPMAVSLAFGILFATVITLLLVPCLYAILQDVRQLGGSAEQPAADAAEPA